MVPGEPVEPSTTVDDSRAVPRAVGLFALACLAALSWLLAARPIVAVDLFWQLALGREIAGSASIPTEDMFSAVHPTRPWVQFQWLWEWGAYQVTRTTGLTGLRAANATLVTAGLVALFLVSRRRGMARGAAFGLVALGLSLTVDRLRLRPDALNFALLVPTLPLLAGGYRKLQPPGLLGAAAWSFLWASVHGGGVLYLVGSAGLLCAGDFAQAKLGRHAVPGVGTPPTAVQASLKLCLAVTAGALLSPTTVAGLGHFLSIYRDMSSDGGEWATGFAVLGERQHPLNYVVVAGPWLALAAFGWRVRQRWLQGQVDLGEVLWSLACVTLSAVTLRFVFLAVVPCWLAVAGPSEPRATRMQRSPRWLAGRRDLIGLGLGLALLAVVAHYAAVAPRGSLAATLEATRTFDMEPTAYPRQSIAFLADAGLTGALLCSRRNGGAAIYYGYPGLRVLADSRHNFTEDIWSLVREVEDPVKQVSAMDHGFERYGLELALLERPLVRYRRPSPDWLLLFEGRRAEVWQHRQGAHAASNLKATRALLARRLPTGVTEPPRDDPFDAGQLAADARQLGSLFDASDPYRSWILRRIDARLAEGGPAREAALRGLARLSIEGREFPRAAAALGMLPAQGDTPRGRLLRAILSYERGDTAVAELTVRGVLPKLAALPDREAITAIELARALSSTP